MSFLPHALSAGMSGGVRRRPQLYLQRELAPNLGGRSLTNDDRHVRAPA